MSAADLLENDLRALANEAKKRQSGIKETVERAIGALRQSPNVPIDPILKAIESVRGSALPKLQVQAIGILQRLLNFQILDSISILSALEFLSNVGQETSDESVQLRTLQTLMLVLNPQHIILTEDLVSNIWKLCIVLENSRSNLVKNTASATLRQLINVSFDKLTVCAGASQEERKESFETKSIFESSLKLFRYITELAGGSHKLWNGDPQKMRSEGIGLMVGVLESSKESFKKLPEFLKILEQVSGGWLQNYLVEDIEESIGAKSIRCAVLVVDIAGQGFDMIGSIAKLAENRRIQEWQQLACLEALSNITSNASLLKKVFEQGNLYTKILDTLSRVSHETFARNNDPNMTGNFKAKIKLIADITNKWVDSLSMLTEKSGVTLGEMTQFPLLPEQIIIEGMLSALWKPLLPILSIMVSNCTDESLLQLMLNSYQSLINISGTLNLSQAREAFLASLSQFCLPAPNTPLSFKNIYTCKTLFNITHCLGCILDVKAWHRVLDTLHKLDFILNTSTKSDDANHTSDIQILGSALESLFSNTHIWPDSTLLDLVSALGQLTLEFMETLATSEKKLNGMKVFGLEKMIVVAQTNLNRITLFWENLAAYLDCICNSKYADIRVMGINSLSRILIKVFKHFVDYPPPPELEKWKNWQRTLFLSLHDLSGSGFADTQEAVFQALFSILQSCGGQLDKTGWGMLLFILSRLDVNTQAAIGFKCLQLIVNDFLQNENLLPSLEKLISCISKFAYQSGDINQAISAVGMYWNVADYLGRVGRDEENLWWLILGELKVLGEDSRPEVRHSAIHSLHVALTTHGACLSSTAWQRLMHDIILSLLQRISTTYFQHATITQEVPILEQPAFGTTKDGAEQPSRPGKKKLQIAIPTDLAHPIVSETPKFAGKSENQLLKGDKIIVHHSRDTLEKQWEETYHIFTQNLGKLFRTYLANLERNEEKVLEQASVKKNWDVLILRLKEGIHNGTTNIITAVLKAVRELLSCSKVSELFFAKWSSSWEIFTTLSNRLQVSKINIPTKLISIILEDLTQIYSSKSQEPFQEKCLTNLFILLNSLLEASKFEATLSNCRLLPEQREVFDFIDKLSETLIANDISLTSYLYFILRFCKYDNQDSHSDAVCRKAMLVLQNIAAKEYSCLIPVIVEILKTYQNLLTLRFSNEAILLMNVTCKGAQPLWYVVGESFLELLPFIMKLDCWELMLDVLEHLLNPSERIISQLSKINLEEIVRLGESLDIKIMEFVKKSMIPASMHLQPQIQWKLVSLLDACCDNYYRAFHSQELSFQNSLSSVCLSGLFDLSRSRPATQEEDEKKSVAEEPLNLKIAKRITPVLISRCKDLLKRFANEERMMGQMPLPKGRLVELLEVLQALKKLEIPQGVLSRPGPKSHLIELFPQLCELITAKEAEIKEALKQIFLEVARHM